MKTATQKQSAKSKVGRLIAAIERAGAAIDEARKLHIEISKQVNNDRTQRRRNRSNLETKATVSRR
jgi:hypothetical protein